MVEKGCLAYLACVWDVSVDINTIESIMVVRNISDVFPIELMARHSTRILIFLLN